MVYKNGKNEGVLADSASEPIRTVETLTPDKSGNVAHGYPALDS